MGFALHNYTDIPDRRILKLVSFAAPSKYQIHKLYVKYSKVFSSSAWFDYYDNNNLKILITIGPNNSYPLTIKRNKRNTEKGYSKEQVFNSKDELLVALIAHEFRHCADYIGQGKFKNWLLSHDARSEIRAESYSAKKVEKFRLIDKRIFR